MTLQAWDTFPRCVAGSSSPIFALIMRTWPAKASFASCPFPLGQERVAVADRRMRRVAAARAMQVHRGIPGIIRRRAVLGSLILRPEAFQGRPGLDERPVDGEVLGGQEVAAVACCPTPSKKRRAASARSKRSLCFANVEASKGAVWRSRSRNHWKRPLY